MRRGRKARQAAPPEASAVGPGFPGGRYKPLTESEMQAVHAAVLDVLENIGVADPIPIVREHALQRGGWMDDNNRLHFPRARIAPRVASITLCLGTLAIRTSS